MASLLLSAWRPINAATRGVLPYEDHYDNTGSTKHIIYNPSAEGLATIFKGVIATLEYYAFNALMRNMASNYSKIATGTLLYRAFSSIVGSETTDPAIAIWLAKEAFEGFSAKPFVWQQNGLALAKGLLAVAFFFHKFAFIPNYQGHLCNRINRLFDLRGDCVFDGDKWNPMGHHYLKKLIKDL